MKTAVIGGGITGLVAAHELVKAGHHPILIEPAQCGGMIRSMSRDGFTLDQGPNVFVERPDMKSLIAELGLAGEARRPVIDPYGQFVWWRGRPVKVPSGLVELMLSPLFSWSTKLLLPFRLCKRGLLKPKGDDASVLEFFAPLIGEQSARDVLDPVLKGIYGGDVDTLSARTIFPALWEAAVSGLSLLGYMRTRPGGGKPSIMVIQGGAQTLTKALVQRLKGRVENLKARVDRIERLPSRGYRLFCSEGVVVDVDACVITPAGAPLAQMIEVIDANLSSVLRHQQYATLSVVHLSVPRSEPLIKDAFGVLFHAGMPDDLLGVMFNSQLFPHVAPADRHVLTVVVGGVQAGSKDVDEQGLKERLPKLLSQLLGISSIDWLCLTTWRDAIPQLKVGHHKVVAALSSVEVAHPGLVFAGVDRGGVGVSDRVRMAREAVERVCRRVAEYQSVA